MRESGPGGEGERGEAPRRQGEVKGFVAVALPGSFTNFHHYCYHCCVLAL